MADIVITLAQIFGPPQWTQPRLPLPPTNHIAHALNGRQQPLHARVQAFYRHLPDHLPATVGYRPPALLEFADALLFVADHPGWRLRKLQGEWRAVR